MLFLLRGGTSRGCNGRVVRGAASWADQQVIGELAARGLVVTASRLEGWRREGLLERHRRRGLGRGRGSVVDAVDPVVVESAAALARHTRQGRDRRLAVLACFAEAGAPRLSGAVVVPEPPEAAVREALTWAAATSLSQYLMELARGAAGRGEEGPDAFYTVAGELVASRPHHLPPHPGRVRATLWADEDLPDDGPPPAAVVHLAAAIGLGPEEVGADALAEAFAAMGVFGLTAEDWARMLGAAELGEAPAVDWSPLGRVTLPLEQARRASWEELIRARAVLTGLRPFYALYVMHGLFMPDTPALAALRARIDERGLGPLLTQLISIDTGPRQFADSLLSCLDPIWHELHLALMEQLQADSDLFCLPGDDTRATGFMETWIRTLREQTQLARSRTEPRETGQ